MNQLKLISIVIPMYNAEEFIGITIESILEQTYQKFEVILVDDGSTDHTSMIVKQYKDPRFFLLIGENQGASYARNWGQSVAKGEYILFFDADDRMYSDMLETLVDGIQQSNADLAIGNHNMIDANGKIMKQEEVSTDANLFFPEKKNDLTVLTGLRPFPDTKLYKTSIIRQNHILFPDAKIGEDLNFYLKYLLCCKSVWKTDHVICSYRILYNSMSHKNDFNAMIGIVESFDDVEGFYKGKTAPAHFMTALINLRVSNYLYQARNWSKMESIKEKKRLLYLFYPRIKQIENESNKYFTDRTVCLIKEFDKTWRRRWFYFSPLHKVYSHLKKESYKNR